MRPRLRRMLLFIEPVKIFDQFNFGKNSSLMPHVLVISTSYPLQLTG